MNKHNSRKTKPYLLLSWIFPTGMRAVREVETTPPPLGGGREGLLLSLGEVGRGLVFVLFLLPVITQGQIITTFAGTGSNVFSGNNVPAMSAGIPDPGGGTFDKYGNYYFADALNANRIRKIDGLGVITTLAGGGTGGFADGVQATTTVLNIPQAVKVDTLGNLFIVDAGNNRIRKVDRATGIISTIAGTGSGTYGGDNGPATLSQLWDPQDICFDKHGNLYVVDAYNARVRKINASGIITTIAGNGTSGYNGDGIAATTAELSLPSGIAIDDTGNIFVADVSGNRVRKVDTFGIITTIAGNGIATYIGDGIAATAAQINPIKIAFDTSGQLFIADHFNYRVLKVDVFGIIHSIAGNGVSGYSGDGGSATAAEFSYPSGVSFDPCGNMYIPEPNNRRIRKVTFNPTCNLSSLNVSKETTKQTISIYPNPSYEQITITANSDIKAITITDLLGQNILTRHISSPTAEVNITGLSPGIYFVTVTDENNNKAARKIVKQ